MKFQTQDFPREKNFSLVYRNERYAFDREPHDGTGFASILINDLQLEIDEEGTIIYVWGLCPLLKYTETDKVPQNYKSHTLSVLINKPLIPGVSYRLNEGQRWPIYINKKKGWVCLGDPNTEDKRLVEFAPHCVATLEGEHLTAIWLHPEKLPDV